MELDRLQEVRRGSVQVSRPRARHCGWLMSGWTSTALLRAHIILEAESTLHTALKVKARGGEGCVVLLMSLPWPWHRRRTPSSDVSSRASSTATSHTTFPPPAVRRPALPATCRTPPSPRVCHCESRRNVTLDSPHFSKDDNVIVVMLLK